MFCENCGNKIKNNDKFCENCDNKIKNITNNNGITCKNCNSNNVSIQIVNESHLVNKHHGIIWWILIGLWWIPVKWIFLTLPALIFKIFGIGKRKKIKNTTYKMAVCQNCGNSFKI